MNSGALTLVVSGPVPGSVRGDAESAAALARELHTRTILHVSRPGVDDSAGSFRAAVDNSAASLRADERPGPDQPPDPGGSATSPLGRKGGGAGSLAELVLTGLFSATTVAALAQVAVAFVERGAARRITLRDGRRTLTISAPSEDTEQMVVEWLGVPPTQSGTGSGAD